MKANKLVIKTQSKSYPIYFGNKNLFKTGLLIKKNLPKVKKIFIIADRKVPKKFLKNLLKSLKKYHIKIYKLQANEKNKDLLNAQKIIEIILKNNFNRTDCIIALGGGMVGDLSAFVSNLTKRGLKFINIPTTLLSQVDASIGGKTGINTNQGKNLIGTFYQPDFVISDVSLLQSLPKREMISGYGEILKHALILNKKFFIWLTKNANKIINNKNNKKLTEAIVKSSKIKTSIVEKDEKEKNLRMILNFGHTFAHGFEKAKNYSQKLNHGEAVLIGMMTAIELSYKKKLLPLSDLKAIKKHYFQLKLPMDIKKYFKKNEIKKIVNIMKNDKKNTNNKINLILLRKIGKVIKNNNTEVSTKEINNFLNSYYF